MPGKPWEKYQGSPVVPEGPWTKYQSTPDIVGESVAAGVKSANDTIPRIGLMPAWERGQAVGRAVLHGLQSDGPLALPNPIAAVREGAEQAMRGDVDSAPTIQNILDQNATGQLLQKEGFKKSFADTQAPIQGLLAPIMGWNKAGDVIGEAPATAARSLIGAETDPLSYVPAEAVVNLVPKPVRNAVSSAVETVPKKLSKVAERLAENATGATGRMKDKLRPGTGRELLERGLIKFGDTAEGVGKRASAEMDRAGEEIGAALKALDDSGSYVEKKKIVDQLTQRIDSLNADPATRPVARKLQKIVDDFQAKEVSETLSLSRAEANKRKFDRKANYLKPNTTEAQKEASAALRNEVEQVATAKDPAMAEKFKKEKDTYGLLKPVTDVAEHRAKTLQQSPYGGLLDVAAAGTGVLTAPNDQSASEKVLTGLAFLLGRRFLAPRMAASGAVGVDKVAGLLKGGPSAKEALSAAKALPGLLRGANQREKKDQR